METDRRGIAQVGDEIRWHIGTGEVREYMGRLASNAVDVVQVYQVGPDDQLDYQEREVIFVDGPYGCSSTETELIEAMLDEWGFGKEHIQWMYEDRCIPEPELSILIAEVQLAAQVEFNRVYGPPIDVDAYARQLSH